MLHNLKNFLTRLTDLEIARYREGLANRDKTIEKMIKECTIECEERIRAERTLHEKKIAVGED